MVDFYGLDKFLTGQASPVDRLLNAITGLKTDVPEIKQPIVPVQNQPNLLDLALQGLAAGDIAPEMSMEQERRLLDIAAQNRVPLKSQQPEIPVSTATIPAPEQTWPERARIAADKTKPMEERAAALKANFPGLEATVDEKGQLVLGGKPSMATTAGAYQGPSANQTALSGNLQSQISSIMAMPDFASKMQKFNDLEVAVAQEKAKMVTDATKMTEVKLGIPVLEAQLREAEQLDRASPKWNLHRVDSQETASIRARLDALRGTAQTQALRDLQGNVYLAGMDAQMSGLKRNLTLAEKSQEKLDYRKEVMSLEEEARGRQAMMAVGPEAIARAKIAMPEMAGGTPEQVALNIKEGIKDPLRNAALVAPDESLPNVAFGEHTVNPYAEKVLIAKEADKAGISLLEAEQKWNNIKTLADNDKALKTKLLQMPKDVQEQFKEMKQKAMTGKKEMLTEYRQAKLNLAKQLDTEMRTTEFSKDVTKWGTVLDAAPLQAAIQAAKNGSQKTDMSSVLAAYLGDTAGRDRRIRVQEFKDYISKAAGGKQSLLSNIDTVTLMNQVEAESVGKSPLSRLMDLPGPRGVKELYRYSMEAPSALAQQASWLFKGQYEEEGNK